MLDLSTFVDGKKKWACIFAAMNKPVGHRIYCTTYQVTSAFF